MPVQGFRVANLEADGLGGLHVVSEHQRVIPEIGAEGGLGAVFLDEFEAEDALGEIGRRAEVAGPEANVSELVDCDHTWHIPGSRTRSRVPQCGACRRDGPDYLFATLVGSLTALKVSNSTL